MPGAFNFSSGDGDHFYCKVCDEPIDIVAYRRLALCPDCEAPVLAKVKGSPDEQVGRILEAHGDDWDDAFLADLNEWWDEIQRRAR